MEEDKKRELLHAVWKKAVGYLSEESIEEFSVSDGDLTLSKKKVTTKEVPPDIAAAKLLMEEFNFNPYENMSEDELEQEKQRLLKQLLKQK